MPRSRTLAAVAVLIPFSTSVFAQPLSSSLPSDANPPPAGSRTTFSAGEAPLVIGRLKRIRNGWRCSKIIGSLVYNDKNQRIGAVNDLIVGQDERISKVVISIGGFLGAGSKLIGVSYKELRFMEFDTNTSERISSSASTTIRTIRLVLPGATRNSLNAMPTFSYAE